ncbi:hypothetical protein B0H65DRAFT_99045 [Neurospora tetraspora]|uniref:Uncharacterized protein n=1 Tax=Neurospora tetraspora TaxID=94610 RepID=A0AAE0JJM2_9PEZI|nr:hypothetical protein B0H65DRAFT_99045 [Neurospora tetraspora]
MAIIFQEQAYCCFEETVQTVAKADCLTSRHVRLQASYQRSCSFPFYAFPLPGGPATHRQATTSPTGLYTTSFTPSSNVSEWDIWSSGSTKHCNRPDSQAQAYPFDSRRQHSKLDFQRECPIWVGLSIAPFSPPLPFEPRDHCSITPFFFIALRRKALSYRLLLCARVMMPKLARHQLPNLICKRTRVSQNSVEIQVRHQKLLVSS